jgi:hypothetical protein
VTSRIITNGTHPHGVEERERRWVGRTNEGG